MIVTALRRGGLPGLCRGPTSATPGLARTAGPQKAPSAVKLPGGGCRTGREDRHGEMPDRPLVTRSHIRASSAATSVSIMVDTC